MGLELGLARWKETYAATGKSISLKELSAELTALKQKLETAWPKEADSQALQQELKDLCRAFTNFFGKRARYPRFKSGSETLCVFAFRSGSRSWRRRSMSPRSGRSIRQSQSVKKEREPPPSAVPQMASGTSRSPPSLICPTCRCRPPIHRRCGNRPRPPDLRSHHRPEDVLPPKFFRHGQRDTSQGQRSLSRRKIGSNRRAKAKLRVARVHQRIANQRGDFLHKLTTRLVLDNDGICIEDLSLKGLARTKLAKSFTDASIGEFRRQLEYKSGWNRKHLVVIDRFFPSTVCAVTVERSTTLTLSDRHWVCGCGWSMIAMVPPLSTFETKV